MATVGELFIFLGFKVDDKQLQNFSKGVKNLNQGFDLTKVAAATAIYGIDRFVETATQGAVALYNFTQQTGLSAQALQQWEYAAHTANPALGINNIAQSIQNLQNNLVEIRRFGAGNSAPFAFLGLDIAHGQNALDILDELHNKLKNGLVDRPLVTNLLGKLGIDPGFINLLEKSDTEYNKFMQSLRQSPEQIAGLQKFAEKIAAFKWNLEQLKSNITAEFLPALNKFLKGLELIAKTADYALQGLKKFGQEFPEIFKTIAIGVGILIAALNPLKTLLLLLTGLLADYYVYTKGGESLIGKVFGKPGDNGQFTKDLYQNNHLGGLYDFLYQLGQGEADITSGKLRKNQPISKYPPLSNNSNEKVVNNNVTFNNDIDINSNGDLSESEKIVNKYKDQLNQIDLNYGLADQSASGTGF